MGFWATFGTIFGYWVALLATIGGIPFSFIIGKELALAICRMVKSVRYRLVLVGNTTASYRLAMLAASQQPDKWKVSDFSKLTHPEIGEIYKGKNGHSYIGYQAIPNWQFDRIYQTVLDGKAMLKMRLLTAATAKEVRESVRRLAPPPPSRSARSYMEGPDRQHLTGS
jgi:hypothetical protein